MPTLPTWRFAVSALLLAVPFLASGAPCAEPGNEIPNCGFETGDPPDNWSSPNGGTLSQNTTVFRNGAASAAVDAESLLFFYGEARADCTAVTPSSSYGVGVYFRVLSNTDPVTCEVFVRYYSDLACGTSVANEGVTNILIDSSSWTRGNVSTDIVALGAQSARPLFLCTSASDFVFLLDDAFMGPNLTPVDLQSYSVD